jgi:hypothetical protein
MAGCLSSRMDEPGHAQLGPEPERSWIIGEENRVWAYWAYACDGTGDWGCPSSTATLLDVTCEGCIVSGDPRGMSGHGRVGFEATATTDGEITIVAKLRFDPTGDTTTVSTMVSGDHEVAVDGACALIDTTTLSQRNLSERVPQELFRSCDTPRLASDTAVIFPGVLTFRGDARFPFCPTTTVCGGFDGDHIRPMSTFVITPAPVGWARTDQIEPSEFGILPPMPSGNTVSLTVQLAPTGTATASVEIPAVR